MRLIASTAFLLLGVAASQEIICDAVCQTSCDAACQAGIQAAFETEKTLWVGNVAGDPFFDTPSNIANMKPGELIRWEDINYTDPSSNWTIPAGLSLSRFMYVTEDMDRSPIPASSWALLPYHNPFSEEKLRTVVWAHGTAGRARQCATTNSKALWYEWQGPLLLAQSGYAVIGPDYSGQGSDIKQGFMYEAGHLHAADVAYSVVAARKAIGQLLSKKWAVFGHSEGGLTAWRTNERLAKNDQKGLLAAGEFIGSVASAPALRPTKFFPLAVKRGGDGPSRDPFSIYVIQTLAALFPNEIKLSDWLHPAALSMISVLDQSCAITGIASIGSLTFKQIWKGYDWVNLPVVQEWEKNYNGAGVHKLAAPMLVVQGDTDVITPTAIVVDEFDATCAGIPDSPILMRRYADMDHFQVSEVAKPDIMKWLNARFEGKPVAKKCVTENVKPITNRYFNIPLNWKTFKAV